eukprot:TRINITY_DN8634_c0_g1_i1.p1 TRINITY_DN8634_c0_g1~~TRINITY_DN8634_c0_g1_i1.p1  ORF type:complete len:389 (-),score=79.83 TRINITY_DN8634_c0_g1_i1:21-1187(-)
MQGSVFATCSAPVNIAVLKYWGKRNEKLILPLHASISGTLHQDDLKTTTTVMASSKFDSDRIWLNGNEENINSERIQNCLRTIRSKITDRVASDGTVVPKETLQSYKIHICSTNNFPTASGLASSASGYACLVYTLAQAFGIKEQYEGELSAIARMGSGSACRSLYGGFVKWVPGEKESGEDSVAVQVAPEEHWPMEILILVVSHKKKEVSSTSGMETSVETSDLIKYRRDVVVPARTLKLEQAIKDRDYNTFAVETMKDSNQFHAICLDTYPPIFYMNDVSKRVIMLITKYNDFCKEIRAAYTFDAGPNAVLYVLPKHIEEVRALVHYYFPVSGSEKYSSSLKPELRSFMDVNANSLEQIMHTKVGPGPQVLKESDSLLDLNSGLPK